MSFLVFGANMSFYSLLLIAATGVVCGFVNVMAGGGSLLSLPMLNFLGLDLGIANATNRVSILLQNISAISLYHRQRKIDWKSIWGYALPAVAGAVAGTVTAIYIPPKAFRLIAAFSICAMGVLLFAKPKMWENPSGAPLSPFAKMAALFAVGVYGGFLQAGVGFFLIWAIVGGCKKNLKEANVIKAIVVAIYTVVSIALFASFGMVNWTAALALACGSVVGARIGAWTNITGDVKWIRWLLIIVVFASAVKIIADSLR